jgi:hypothetical protein
MKIILLPKKVLKLKINYKFISKFSSSSFSSICIVFSYFTSRLFNHSSTSFLFNEEKILSHK